MHHLGSKPPPDRGRISDISDTSLPLRPGRLQGQPEAARDRGQDRAGARGEGQGGARAVRETVQEAGHRGDDERARRPGGRDGQPAGGAEVGLGLQQGAEEEAAAASRRR